MSVKIMGIVWDTPLNPTAKLVLLALADHADHEGRNAYPSIALLARKTGFRERTIQATLRRLESSGLLVRGGPVKGLRTYNYTFVLSAYEKGESRSPSDGRVQDDHPMGESRSPSRVQDDHPMGDPGAPDPSINRPLNREGNRAPHKPMTYAQHQAYLKKLISDSVKKSNGKGQGDDR